MNLVLWNNAWGVSMSNKAFASHERPLASCACNILSFPRWHLSTWDREIYCMWMNPCRVSGHINHSRTSLTVPWLGHTHKGSNGPLWTEDRQEKKSITHGALFWDWRTKATVDSILGMITGQGESLLLIHLQSPEDHVLRHAWRPEGTGGSGHGGRKSLWEDGTGVDWVTVTVRFLLYLDCSFAASLTCRLNPPPRWLEAEVVIDLLWAVGSAGLILV